MSTKAKSGVTKTTLAQEQGISRTSLYYQPKQPDKDWLLKNQIEQVLKDNHSYGHRRIAQELGRNKKAVLRVMKLFGIKPYRRRGRKWHKAKDNGRIYPNLLHSLDFPDKPNMVWVSDFTRLPFHGKVIYLATVMDIFDRRVKGWCLLNSHTVQLTLTALMAAVEKYGRPEILHSDQGSEYKSLVYTSFAESLGLRLSMSHKSAPWENGYQESFYSQFKVDLGDWNRFKTLGELAVAVYLQIHYYNTRRIHSKLKMPPAVYARQRILTSNYVAVRV